MLATALGASYLGSLATLGAAEFSAPRRFQADETARAIASTSSGDWSAKSDSAFERPSADGVLRWRVKQPVQGAETTTTAKTTKSVVAKRSSAVRQASHTDDDAFANPFGDRKVRTVQAEEPADPLEPMGLNPPQTGDDDAPRPMRPQFQRPQLQPRPAPPDAIPEPEPEPEVDENSRPNAKYNERNCDAEGKNCADNRLRLKSDILINKNNLLDITPPLVLSTDTQQQGERAKQNFQRIPARDWRDRSGKVIAHGRLEGVSYRLATVIDASGETVKIPLGVLGDDEQCFLAGWWNVPAECALGDEVHPGRDFIPATMTWTASALCHKPLYFEETQLERYGHTAGIFQPALSGAHFFINIAILPYHMGINPPNECQYALGYYRPGSCAPWMVPPIPLSVRGAATQAAAVGIIYPLIP